VTKPKLAKAPRSGAITLQTGEIARLSSYLKLIYLKNLGAIRTLELDFSPFSVGLKRVGEKDGCIE